MTNKQLAKSKTLNGYEFCYYDNTAKLFVYTKQVNNKFVPLLCKKEDLTNGNFEYMAKNGLTRRG